MTKRVAFALVAGIFGAALSTGAAVADQARQDQTQKPSQGKTQKTTQTVANLRTAIQGEANAAHRYTLFAQKAEIEGYGPVAKLFRAAALSEEVHLRNHVQVLRSLGQPLPEIKLEQVSVGSTQANLKVPIEGEKTEATQMYPKFIAQARADGVEAAARSFTYARDAEAEHDRLFKKALANLGHNQDVDYYVQPETGMVIEKSPGRYPPVTTR